MQPETGVRTWQWVVTAIVIIVLIIIGIMVFGGKGGDVTGTDTDVAGNQDTGVVGANSVIISDQYPGNVVYVSSVTLEKGGWVVIHKDNKGVPGDVIGSTYVPAGVGPAKVTVTSAIVDGGLYYAMLHSDDGDKKFDIKLDLPLKDTAGNIIMKIFHGSASADMNVKG